MSKTAFRILSGGLLSALATLHISTGIADDSKLSLKLSETVTVSGVSSGGYMANQFHIAHSDRVTGAGIIAAGPYLCSEGNLMTAMKQCLADGSPLQATDLNAAIMAQEQAQQIAATENLRNDRVWLLHGTLDKRVGASVSNALQKQYANLIDKDNVRYINDKPFNHALPTDDFGLDCSVSASPFISDCDYDAAGEMLSWLYPDSPANKQPTSGQLYTVAQPKKHHDTATGLDDNAYLYVPKQCRDGESCKLHISFHGCQQNAATIGTKYALNGGFNEQADALNLVVLYPQIAANNPLNPLACWDWWGYTGSNFASHSGAQIAAIAQMMSQLQNNRLSARPVNSGKGAKP